MPSKSFLNVVRKEARKEGHANPALAVMLKKGYPRCCLVRGPAPCKKNGGLVTTMNCTCNCTKSCFYRWRIDWGDGSVDNGYQEHLGPFQQVHQYDKTCYARCYNVIVYYCHDPGCPSERCCDSYSRVIDVTGSSGKGIPGYDYNSPLGR